MAVRSTAPAALVADGRRGFRRALARLNDIPVLNKCLLGLALVLAWQVASRFYPAFILPSPLAVLGALGEASLSAEMYGHLLTSLFRLLTAFAFSAVVGVIIGYLMSVSALFRNQFDGVIRAIQPIPGVAWTGILLIWFGIGDLGIIVVVIVTILPLVALTSYTGFSTVDQDLVKAARTLGARSRRHVFRHVVLPAALPVVVNGLHLGLAYGWRTLAGAEMIGALSGLGYWLNLSRTALRTEQVFAVLVIFAVLMIALEAAVWKPLQRKVLGGWARALEAQGSG